MKIRMAKFWKAVNESCGTSAEFPFSDSEIKMSWFLFTGFIYWRLLSTDPAAAKEVVLAEKPLISEETDLIEPTLLDELICHIASLASVINFCLIFV